MSLKTSTYTNRDCAEQAARNGHGFIIDEYKLIPGGWTYYVVAFPLR